MRSIILVFSLLSFYCYANFNIQPLTQSMDPTTKSATYTLENLTNQKSAYEVQIFSRSLNSDGKEIRTKTKEIRVFPSKLILAPKQKKRIKVLYLGNRNIESEKSYRVVFMQTDRVVTEQGESGVSAKFNFHTAFYVTPKKAESDLTYRVVSTEKGSNLVLENKGTKHIILKDWQLNLGKENNNNTYPGELPDINMLAHTKVTLPLNSSVLSSNEVEIISN